MRALIGAVVRGAAADIAGPFDHRPVDMGAMRHEPSRCLAAADQNRDTKPSPVASMRPANGAPTWPGHASAPVAAQWARMRRRLIRASSASELLGKFQSG